MNFFQQKGSIGHWTSPDKLFKQEWLFFSCKLMEELKNQEELVAAAREKPVSLVSVTDLSSFLYCPKLLYMQRVLGRVEKPSLPMILGAIRHSFHDLANKYEKNIVVHLPASLSQDAIAAAYSATYNNLLRAAVITRSRSLAMFEVPPFEIIDRLRPVAAEEARERAGNVFKFSAENNLSGESLWQQLSPKIITEMRVKSSPLMLRGTVDRVEVYTNTVLPIELKTGKMPRDGVWQSHRVQVAAYMMLLSETFNVPIGKAIVRYLDHGEGRTVVLNPYMELEVTELREKVSRLVSGGIMPPPCGREGCGCWP